MILPVSQVVEAGAVTYSLASLGSPRSAAGLMIALPMAQTHTPSPTAPQAVQFRNTFSIGLSFGPTRINGAHRLIIPGALRRSAVRGDHAPPFMVRC